MKPTKEHWSYDDNYQHIWTAAWPYKKPLATIHRQLGMDDAEAHANGYLMAASPALRDELSNLSRAVRAHLETKSEEDRLTFERMEAILERAERALATIFPPEAE